MDSIRKIDDLVGFRRFGVPALRSGIAAAVVGLAVFAGLFDASARGLLETIELSGLHGGNGFAIDMGDGKLSFGHDVSGVGDVNADGIEDFIVRTPGLSFFGSNIQTAVVFGTDVGFPARLALSTLDGTNGFALAEVGGGVAFGKPVAGVGDVNGDGIDDIAMTSQGKSYVVFGTDLGFPAVFNLASLDGDNGFSVNRYENAIAGAGDVNGDGFADIIIGDDRYLEFVPSPYDPWGGSYDMVGRAYIVFGGAGGFPAQIDVAALDGSNGFAFQGADEFGRLGYTVSGAGDVNGDGMDDIIVGAGLSHSVSGQAFVLFGTDQGFSAVVRTAELDGSNGFAVYALLGIDSYVASAGDMNNDGFGDIAIGMPYMPGETGYDFGTGRAYVIFGRGAAFPARFDVSALNGKNGFFMSGGNMGDLLGFAVSAAGDVNGDRVGDLIISAPGVSANGVPASGQSYVLFGSARAFPAEIPLTYFDGIGGFAMNGAMAGGYSGFSAAGLGDINADGVDDVAVGTYSMSGHSEDIFSVVFGRRMPVFAAADGASRPGCAGIESDPTAPGCGESFGQR